MNEDIDFDVVIIGGGVAGAILAKELTRQKATVLMLEAGDGETDSLEKYRNLLQNYYLADIKIPNSPYPVVRSPEGEAYAGQPTVLDDRLMNNGGASQYMLQAGPMPHRSSYTRILGGTVLHWLGTCLRMVPENFEMEKRFRCGRNWPLDYWTLQKHYQKAEEEIGVSADVSEQGYLGIEFEEDYVFPMHRVPPSYLDKVLQRRLRGMVALHAGHKLPLQVVSTPQGRNSTPNRFFNGGHGFKPKGAVGNPEVGQRCIGNSSCVPICPVQAKYNPLKTLASATREHLQVSARCVASKVHWDKESGDITGVEYISYDAQGRLNLEPKKARGRLYVLAAHAVENAKLLLNSGIRSSSGLVGKNLMDHPVMLTWGLMPEPVWSYRGPGSTSGIPIFAAGAFRADSAAFRIEIGNWGWNWAAGAPYSTVDDLVHRKNLFGQGLRDRLGEEAARHIRFGFLFEQLPTSTNRVEVDPGQKDVLGIPRPIVHYDVDEYTRRGMSHAKSVSDQIFRFAGIEDHTHYNPADPGYVDHDGEGFVYFGAGHFGGTHVMGTRPETSVVDSYQQSWDHKNLYIVGCGSFPTMGTENPTLTMAAMAYRTAESISARLTGK